MPLEAMAELEELARKRGVSRAVLVAALVRVASKR
jgi:hypothetical protein